MNYFELFNLEKTFEIDLKALRNAYIIAQGQYHPDKSLSEHNKLHLLNKSAAINEGYKILKDELLRAKYLLQLEGLYPFEYAPKNDILSNNFMLCEMLEDIDNSDLLEIFLNKRLSERKILIEKLTNCFRVKSYAIAIDLVLELKYLDKLIGDTKQKKQDLENATT